ncbi:hypothetical protein [Archangium lansingense]|uniref:Uncharacterized protein n=1 Tax=Archangium lansingense TaxID=2995310 RepID=A0ABT4AF23_9BACT|nr:hypothetical protein [Archangium lansinium]MCY1080279.1 hypothetical protein [Archangium lansinium]
MFLTDRLRALMGLPAPEEPKPRFGPLNLRSIERCCDKAKAERCLCEWYYWVCPDHPATGGCHPTNTHD